MSLLQDVTTYVEAHIGDFHQKRLLKLQALKLNQVLSRKNPYLFRAKHILTAEPLVRALLDAYLSSQEETLFGDFLESVAIFVCHRVYGGYKPAIKDLEGIDLVFERDGNRYVVEIKSGPNWGNSSQIKKMVQNFQKAQHNLGTEVIPINGCCYGQDQQPYKNQQNYFYWKLCGQDFWEFISNDPTLYLNLIEPLAHSAKQRASDFDDAYATIVNRFTRQFSDDFTTHDRIDWDKLVRYVSERHPKRLHPFHVLGD